VLWRKSLGAIVTQYAGADGNGNGVIDQADLLRWRADFAAAAGAGTVTDTSIPEPAEIVSICIAIAIIVIASSRIQLR
jgi:hypothetical protein